MVLEKSPSKRRRSATKQPIKFKNETLNFAELTNTNVDTSATTPITARRNLNAKLASEESKDNNETIILQKLEELFSLTSITNTIDQNLNFENKAKKLQSQTSSNKENSTNFTSNSDENGLDTSSPSSSPMMKKRRRRRSFLDSPAINCLKSAAKKSKKRRESLLSDNNNIIEKEKESNSDNSSYNSASDCSDVESGFSSSGETPTIGENLYDGFYSLESMIDYLLFSNSSSKFLTAFLLTHNGCVKSIDIIQYLILRWNDKSYPKYQSAIQKRIVFFLSKWIANSDENSFDSSSIHLLDEFIDSKILHLSNNESQNLISSWRKRHLTNVQISSSTPNVICNNNINNNANNNNNGSGNTPILSVHNNNAIPSSLLSLETTHQMISEQLNQNGLLNGFNLSLHKKYTPLEFASQLTLFNHRLFKKIHLNEITNSNWMSKEKQKISSNLLKMINQSTSTTMWIITQILSEFDIKERAKIIKFFILVAQKCKELSNYDGVMSIIGALQTCSIDRLKKTWSEISSKTIKIFESLCDIMLKENFKEYRLILKQTFSPCVPFPGMWLTDLQFIDTANEWEKLINSNDYLQMMTNNNININIHLNNNNNKKEKKNNHNEDEKKRLINMNKMIMVSKVFQEVQRFQQANYVFNENREIQHILRNFQLIDEDKAYEISCELEPIHSNNSSNNSNNNMIENIINVSITHSNTSNNLDQISNKISKLEVKARSIQSYEELLLFIEKCNRKCTIINTNNNLNNELNNNNNNNEIITHNNYFIDIICSSEVIEILLEYLITHPITANLMNSLKLLDLQKQVCYQLQILFSYCLVGDDQKRQQLLECLNIIWNLYLRSQDLNQNLFHLYFKELINCFKIPPQYRQLGDELNKIQAEIDQYSNILNELMQSQFIQQDDEKECKLQQRIIKINRKIVHLQNVKQQKIDLKVQKKFQIQRKFIEIQKKYQVEVAKIAEILNKTNNVANEKNDIVLKLKANEENYKNEKVIFQEEKNELVDEETKLMDEKKALLERLAKIDKSLKKIQSKKEQNESNYKNAQQKFQSNKQQLKLKADNLILLLQCKEQQNKELGMISNILFDFEKFFSNALGLSEENSLKTITQMEEEENYFIYKEKYLKSIYIYLSIKESSLLHIRDVLKRNTDTINSINKMHLSVDVLHNEFPQYVELNDKIKSLKKEVKKSNKEFNSFIEKHQLLEDKIVFKSDSENAKKCRNLFSIVSSLFTELSSY